MSGPTPVRISRRAARRFLIEALDLSSARPYDSARRIRPDRVLQEIRRLECVQLDPVAAVARNQHLVLAARLPGYTTQSLERLLAERRIFEYWANAACVIPIDDYWMFEGVRQRLRKYVRKERGLLRRPVSYVLRELERSGPMSSRAFTTAERIAGYWDNKGPKTKATTHALNVLWVAGEVLVVRREGMKRYFDLRDEVVPANQLRRAEETDPREADRALLEKYIRAFRIFDLGDFRFGWQKIPAARRRPLIERYLKDGTVVPLEIDGVRRAYFAPAEDIEQIRRHERDGSASFGDGAIRFLAPLDNLLWRRERLADLFDFSYVWEIYVPAHKRRFGYYTMPILAGEHLIGRMDPRLDRASGRLIVRMLGLEPHVRPTARLRRRLDRALEAFARFHGANQVDVQEPLL